jgi:multicomponent Na+:H+ antiporter subunit F
VNAVLWGAVAAELLIVGVLSVRLARGPSVTDRVVALNTMSIQGALAVVCFSLLAGRSLYLDIALWLVSFGCLGGLLWARYLERGLL